MSTDNFFEEIPEDDVQGSRRGRRPNPETQMVADRLATVKKGKALRIGGMGIDLNGKDEATVKKEKARIAAVLRSGAAIVNLKISVIFGNDGIPTVKIIGPLDGTK